jgi:pSer/pThr/pTyr-binding forkhead associated (FHA) protein
MVSAHQAQHTLIVNSGPNIGQSYMLSDMVSTLGRSADNTIVLDSTQVSRYHTKITLLPTGAVIEDMGSTNGTFINGQQIFSQYSLTSGDTIGIADYITFQYVMEGSVGGVIPPSTKGRATRIMDGSGGYGAAPVPTAPQIPPYTPDFQQNTFTPPPPSAYPSVPNAKPQANRRNPTSLYVIIAVLVVLICFCVAVAIFLWFAPEAFWRDIFDFFGIPWPSAPMLIWSIH